jgi:hypothetical protein
MPGVGAVQASFEDLGTSLFHTTFTVLDLETTGLSPARDRITEIGAVKVRGGDVLGEFHCLVSPGQPIPPAVATLTGITDAVVALRPDWLRRRGTASLRNPGSSEVAVYLAGVRVGGPGYLRQIRAADVASLEYLNAADASNRYGLGHSGGAILIRPRDG